MRGYALIGSGRLPGFFRLRDGGDAGQNPPTFAKDIAPILQEKCQNCHRNGSMAPMSLVTYEETRPWAKVDQAARGHPQYAAVAPGQDRRHPAIPERHVAHRRADRRDRPLGGCGRAAGRPEGHAAAQAMAERRRLATGEAVRPAGLHPQIGALHDAGQGPGRVVQAAHANSSHRAALGARGGDAAGDSGRPQDHASCARLSAAG